MNSDYCYTIGQVSAQTGLPPHLIRVWESRYSAVSPMRSSNNRRIFCANDITKLRLLNKAVKNGHSISQVAALAPEELIGITGNGSYEARHYLNVDATASTEAEPIYQKALQLTAELDVVGLQTVIEKAAINLTRPVLILDVLLPLYYGTKRLVKKNNLRLINLNAVSSVLRAFLWDLLRATVISESAPKIVIGTPLGHRSEIAALVLALTAAESGYRSLYFGSNLQANDLAAAVKSKGAQAVAIFVEGHNAESEYNPVIIKLREMLDDDVVVLVCTFGTINKRELLTLEGITVTTLEDFRQKLENSTIENLV